MAVLPDWKPKSGSLADQSGCDDSQEYRLPLGWGLYPLAGRPFQGKVHDHITLSFKAGHRIESGKQSGIRQSGIPTVPNSRAVGKRNLVGKTGTPFFQTLQM